MRVVIAKYGPDRGVRPVAKTKEEDARIRRDYFGNEYIGATRYPCPSCHRYHDVLKDCHPRRPYIEKRSYLEMSSYRQHIRVGVKFSKTYDI